MKTNKQLFPEGGTEKGTGHLGGHVGLFPHTSPTHLTSVKLLAFWINVFHIKNILEQDARHRKGHESCRGAERAATTGNSRTPSRGEKKTGQSTAPKAATGQGAHAHRLQDHGHFRCLPPLGAPELPPGKATSELLGPGGRVSKPGDSAQGGDKLGPTPGGYRAATGSTAPSSDPGSRSLQSLGA